MTFFDSFYKAAQRMSEANRARFYNVIMDYAFEGKEPEAYESETVLVAFEVARVIIDKSEKRIKDIQKVRKAKANTNTNTNKEKECVCVSSDTEAHTHTHTQVDSSVSSDDVPQVEQAVNVALKKSDVPEWYICWWYNENDQSGWHTSDGKPINKYNWLALLKGWWRKSSAEEREKIRSDLRGPALSEDERGEYSDGANPAFLARSRGRTRILSSKAFIALELAPRPLKCDAGRFDGGTV